MASQLVWRSEFIIELCHFLTFKFRRVNSKEVSRVYYWKAIKIVTRLDLQPLTLKRQYSTFRFRQRGQVPAILGVHHPTNHFPTIKPLTSLHYNLKDSQIKTLSYHSFQFNLFVLITHYEHGPSFNNKDTLPSQA